MLSNKRKGMLLTDKAHKLIDQFYQIQVLTKDDAEEREILLDKLVDDYGLDMSIVPNVENIVDQLSYIDAILSGKMCHLFPTLNKNTELYKYIVLKDFIDEEELSICELEEMYVLSNKKTSIKLSNKKSEFDKIPDITLIVHNIASEEVGILKRDIKDVESEVQASPSNHEYDEVNKDFYIWFFEDNDTLKFKYILEDYGYEVEEVKRKI